MTPTDFLATRLPAHLEPAATGEAYAPANIALAKYWGKRDRALNLPVNGSLSISLGDLGTHTTVRAANRDRITLNGSDAAPDSALHRRTFAFIDLWRRGDAQPLHIETRNTIPTAAGLASSASGFAALTMALARYWQLNLADSALSAIARLGSGSAVSSNGSVARATMAATASPRPSPATGRNCALRWWKSTAARKKPRAATA